MPTDIAFTNKPRRPPSIILARKGGGIPGSFVSGLFVSFSTFIEKKLEGEAVKETPKHRYVFSVLESSEKTAYVFGKRGNPPSEVSVEPYHEYTVNGRTDLDRQMEDVRANPKRFVGVPFKIIYEEYMPNRHGGHSHIYNVQYDARYINTESASDVGTPEGEGQELEE